MRNPSSPPVTPSAAAHAERIRVREQARTAEQGTAPAAQSTAEMYAARILPGYRADEALRQQARMNELRARGMWVPSDDEETEGAEDEFEEYDDTDEEVEEVDDEERPRTTAEIYAARERKRIEAERVANRAAWRTSTDVGWQNALRPI